VYYPRQPTIRMSATPPRPLIFMPAYNAAGRLPGVVRRIPADVWEAVDGLVVVDDGSADATADAVKALMAEFPKIELVRHAANRGYGGAQKTGYRRALELGAAAVVMLHSDGQYPPELLPAMLAPLADGYDVVGGSRSKYGGMRQGGMSLARYWGTILLTALENLVFRQHLTIYHSGYRAYSRAALERIPFERYSDTFNFDSEMLVGAFRARLPIAEVPIPTIHGAGYSSLSPIPYGLSVLRTLARYLLGRI
jgi:glycosyltransferase involved in cell wall biosynthesis